MPQQPASHTIVLFDGTSLDAWISAAGRPWIARPTVRPQRHVIPAASPPGGSLEPEGVLAVLRDVQAQLLLLRRDP